MQVSVTNMKCENFTSLDYIFCFMDIGNCNLSFCDCVTMAIRVYYENSVRYGKIGRLK
jgi:hypothetical protein